MPTALERLEELEKQVAATQVAHVELELTVSLQAHIIGHLVTTGRVPTQQQLTQMSREVTKAMMAKYPGLHIEAAIPAPAPVLFIPNGHLAKGLADG